MQLSTFNARKFLQTILSAFYKIYLEIDLVKKIFILTDQSLLHRQGKQLPFSRKFCTASNRLVTAAVCTKLGDPLSIMKIPAKEKLEPKEVNIKMSKYSRYLRLIVQFV